jgi:hypothetical protein
MYAMSADTDSFEICTIESNISSWKPSFVPGAKLYLTLARESERSHAAGARGFQWHCFMAGKWSWWKCMIHDAKINDGKERRVQSLLGPPLR